MARKKEKKSGLGRLLENFGNQEDLDALKHGLQESEQSGPDSPPPPPSSPAMEDDPTKLIVQEGALLRLWQRWMGEGAMPPILSLLGDMAREDLPLDEQGFARERVRLKAQLEKHAKERLRRIEENDKREGPDLNAACKAYVARSGMVAWIFLFPPSGENGELAQEIVGKALQESKVTTGIDPTQMMNVVMEKAYFKLVPIARGTLPVEGEDGACTELFTREIEQEVKLDENGLADYRSLNYVRMIEKGTVICDITHPKPGTPGVRVDGKVVEPKPVRPAKLPAGTNTTVTEDGLRLVATREGHLEFSGGDFHVRPVLEVKGDVDYSVGNIDFHGDVHIHGDVREDFFIRATGSVTVDGLVEAASIEAGADLLVSCGVLGDNRALIKCGGNVRAKYLENCVVYAAKCVYADCIVSSQIFSDDAVDVTSGRGTIIGGTVMAAHTVKARMIGSQSGRQTNITLGVLPYVQEQLNNDTVSMEFIRKELEALEKDIAYLSERQGMEGGNEKLAKANLRRSVLGMKVTQILKRRERLAPLNPDLSKCRLECDMVYPVTCLTIQNVVRRIEQMRRRYRAGFDIRTGEIHEV